MSLQYSDQVRDAYAKLFSTCSINSTRLDAVKRDVTSISKSRNRYESVAGSVNIPWEFIAVVHCMEASLNFNAHLHNGDPLTKRTVHVPANRPLTGNPPFTWEQSATDALRMHSLDKVTDWTLPSMLYHLEAYNGFGYRRQDPVINTPYLWSYSNHYTAGKFVADGKYDPKAVSKQCGAAALLLQMADQHLIQIT